jgi:hypothetical protein
MTGQSPPLCSTHSQGRGYCTLSYAQRAKVRHSWNTLWIARTGAPHSGLPQKTGLQRGHEAEARTVIHRGRIRVRIAKSTVVQHKLQWQQWNRIGSNADISGRRERCIRIRGGSRPEDHNVVDKSVRRVDGGGTDEAQRTGFIKRSQKERVDLTGCKGKVGRG